MHSSHREKLPRKMTFDPPTSKEFEPTLSLIRLLLIHDNISRNLMEIQCMKGLML